MTIPEKTCSQIRPGFTLTELLVVIVIIANLAALAFFVTKRVRAMADKTNPIRNLRQLQSANMSYAADHNGRCVPIRANEENGNPTRRFQDEELLAYLTGKPTEALAISKLSCIPLDLLDPKVVQARKPLYDKIYRSYGMKDSTLLLGGDPDVKFGHHPPFAQTMVRVSRASSPAACEDMN